MQGKSHLAIGTTTAAWFAYALPLPTNGMRVMVGLMVAFGSLCPDIDHAHSKITRSVPGARILCWIALRFGDHRGWTHQPFIGPPIFGIVTAAATWFIPGPIGAAFWALGLAMAVGCWSHVYADCRTVSGVRCGRHTIRIGRTFVTGSDAELIRYRFLYRPLSWGSVAAALGLAAR